MGDRGNIKCNDRDRTIYLYTHWTGSALPTTLKSALERGRDRWTDPAYLSRIIFCEMLKQSRDPLEATTGFGISTELQDNEHPIIDVDIPDQTVTIGKKSWSFGDFVK